MEKTNLLTLVVTLTVGIVLAGSLLMPVVTDASETQKTFENKGYYALNTIDNTTELTMVWDTTTPTQVTIDDVVVPLTPTSGRYTLLGSDTLCIRWTATDQIQIFGTNINNNYVYKSLSASQGGTVTITVSAGQVTVDVNGSTAIYFLGNDAYCIAPNDGDFVAVMKEQLENAYVKGDSEIRLIGMSIGNTQSAAIGISGIGTIDNGMELSTLYIGSSHTSDPVSYSDIVAVYDEVNGYDDLYTLEKYTFTINYDGTETSEATYNYFIVPASVTAEKSQHLDDSEIALIGTLPIIVIVGLVLAAVGTIFIRNRD